MSNVKDKIKLKPRMLLTTQNAKTSKGEKLNYLTGILYLAPSTVVQGLNLCKFASAGCKAACLYTAGRGRFNNVQSARIAKTELYRDNLEYFMTSLVYSIQSVIRKAKRERLIPVIRLNDTSDIRWENIRDSLGQNIFEKFPSVQFYDYTKDFKRFDKTLPSNYHLTFSWSESNGNAALKLLKLGVNVAAVFIDIPKHYLGYDVINGDEHDLRFLDKKGVVGLKAKGQAKKDKSGFVKSAADRCNSIAA